MTLEEELRRIFGYDRFRPGQKPLVEALLSGRDALGILPTGGGKSVCYQLPALLGTGLTVVVSPLIALMKDQIDGLRRRGIDGAADLHSNLGPGEAARRLREAAAGRLRLLYLAPERLAAPGTTAALRRAGVRRFVVDEAHCISHWGHDFRPDYLRLSGIAAHLGAGATLALTATATPRVRAEISARLGLRSPCVIVNPFDRPNLFLGARRVSEERKVEEAARLLGADGAAIVYVGRQKDAVAVAAQLRKRGISAVPYHGGMPAADRARSQDDWIRGRARVVVGTVAFGMGIDKPDVRSVVHLHMPGSLESLYQEIGRAGRDGAPSRCWLLHSPRDSSLHHFFIERRYPSESEIRLVHARLAAGEPPPPPAELPPEKWSCARAWLIGRGLLGPSGPPSPLPVALDLEDLRGRRAADLARLESMVDWTAIRRCRRAALLRYFGERAPEDLDCRNCDVCGERGSAHGQAREFGMYAGRRDGDDDAVRAALLAAVAELGPRGITRAALEQVLAGRARPAARRGLHRSPHLGALEGLGPRRLAETRQALVEEGAVDAVPGPRSTWAASGPRPVVPVGEAMRVLVLVAASPGRLSRTAAARRLGGDVAAWAERLELLARSGYLDVDRDARLTLTARGIEAMEASRRRGAV
ncbi:MAG: RecQ family ATP-dependent DNA helicase [Planctomycetia bacterium]|nr:RecQ family ATP-dependent DNA helicase [Planctomycetia bacterium]